ncbi:MAG: S8/S53 family peptidase, partial [Candidatus Eremiobacteraeota bacterium]|nr:S8/S53 family peptidase [Candidatus Eremiobacteraeota bacterium]
MPIRTLGGATLVLSVGLLTACSGHSASSLPSIPTSNTHAATQTTTQTTQRVLGTRMTRAAAVASAPAGWSATATQATLPANASDNGALSPSQPVTVRLGLQLRNVDQLNSLVASGQQVDPGSFTASYGPTSDQVSAVSNYLVSQGFTNVTVEPNNLVISATGTAANASQAFNTTLHGFTANGANVFANVSPAYVPASLGGVVVAVLGLNNIQMMKPKPLQQPTPCQFEGVSTPSQACLRFYDPATFQIAYDAGSTTDAHDTAIAIMTEGNVSQSISDFRLNEQQFGLQQVPINQIQVGLASPDTSGDGEWTLDMTYSSGIANRVKEIDLYTTTSLNDSDITLMYSRWVTDHRAAIGNSSFGGCEFGPYLDGSMLIDDELFLQGAAQGQTMFASSGDSGSFCGVAASANGVPAGAPFVEYPAASPYTVAVGGTDLFSNADGTYKGEQSWEAGGGGLSQFEYSPYWEQTEQPVSQNVSSMRGVPDVAMDAAIETGALLWGGSAVNGSCTPCVTGGTSLASPLSAGTYARFQTAHGNHLGFAPVLFYKNYTEHAAGAANTGPPAWEPWGGFHDIITGANGAYTALPGYDYTTGLGSFDISV